MDGAEVAGERLHRRGGLVASRVRGCVRGRAAEMAQPHGAPTRGALA